MSALAPTLSRKRWTISASIRRSTDAKVARAVSSSAMVTNSSAACACSMSPGPKTTASIPCSEKRAASVQNPRSTALRSRSPSSGANAAKIAGGERRARLDQRPLDRVRRRGRPHPLLGLGEQLVDARARRRAQRERQRRARRDDVEGDPAVERRDVEVDPREARRPLPPMRDPHLVERHRRARQHRHGIDEAVDERRVSARPRQRHGGRADAAVADADPAAGRLADDRPLQADRRLAGQEGVDASATPLLVAREQDADGAGRLALPQDLEHRGDRPLGVGRAEAVQAIAAPNQEVRR